MTEAILAGAALATAGLASHAFHSWLKQRERERLSTTDKGLLLERFDELAKWRNRIDNVVANLPRR